MLPATPEITVAVIGHMDMAIKVNGDVRIVNLAARIHNSGNAGPAFGCTIPLGVVQSTTGRAG